MKIIITQMSAGISAYADLKKWAREFGYTHHRCRNIEARMYQEGDPDKIKCEGRELLFIDVDLNGIKYILTSDYATDQEKEMLCRFHGAEREETFTLEECKWSCYDSSPKAIAYRGGQGYYYDIWAYNPKPDL